MINGHLLATGTDGGGYDRSKARERNSSRGHDYRVRCPRHLTSSATAMLLAGLVARQLMVAKGASFGCALGASQFVASQQRATRMLGLLLPLRPTPLIRRVTQPGGKAFFFEIQDSMKEVLRDWTSNMVTHVPSVAGTFSLNSGLAMPCVPGIILTELLQLLWIWKIENDAQRAANAFVRHAAQLAWLREQPWVNILEIGFGTLFVAAQTLCQAPELAPRPPVTEDEELETRRLHEQVSDATLSGATVFKQYHRLVGFDYRNCILRFVGASRVNSGGIEGGDRQASVGGGDGQVSAAVVAACSRLSRSGAAADDTSSHAGSNNDSDGDMSGSGGGNLWPHMRFVILAARQPAACGAVCRHAAAFALVAQALLLKPSQPTPTLLNQDQRQLLEAAQIELLAASPLFWQEGGSHTLQSCALARAFPVWTLLASLGNIDFGVDGVGASSSATANAGGATAPSRDKDGNSCGTGPASCTDSRGIVLDANDEAETAEAMMITIAPGTNSENDRSSHIGLRQAANPAPFQLAYFCDSVSGWPPLQRLTSAGALAIYSLIHAVGGILDAFGVRWWASAGSLLGAVRNGGMMPQDCDVDIAIWRADAHQLTRPEFRGALAAAGVASYQMPMYLEFRFCLAQVPAMGERRSVDGQLSCVEPYIDGHLADVSHDPHRWHYIHQTDLQYAHTFPLAGLFGYPDEAGGSWRDYRRRVPFGDHAEVWAPEPFAAEAYLDIVYGSDWRMMLRGRYGAVVYNDSARGGASFRGLVAKPTGPLRDFVGELQAFGALPRNRNHRRRRRQRLR
eukprot:TRINITY_DN43659_c0_g1_i1.p1 TRINITY_DN43659_c0_g1~~TRINITY_DN43659_c0_g1_i1.p1  ORF type:complete len:795 (-),score=121.44 TRINITY_DN43659_c0_g1_i1:158-2542(-)